MKKYVVENWLTEEVIKVFNSEEERNAWIKENCVWYSDGCFIDGTTDRISIYEED